MEINNIKTDHRLLADAVEKIVNRSVPYGKEEAPNVSMAQIPPQANIEAIKSLLASYNLTLGEENINLLQALMENELPADKQTLLKLNQAHKLFNVNSENKEAKASSENVNLQKALFTLKNEMPVSAETVSKVNNFLSKNSSITLNVEKIAEELSKVSHLPEFEEVLDIFTVKEKPAEPPNSAPIPQKEATTVEKPEQSLPNSKVISSEGENIIKNLTSEQKETLANTLKEVQINTAEPDKIIAAVKKIIDPENKLNPKEMENIVRKVFENTDEAQISDKMERIFELSEKNTAQKLKPAEILKSFSINPRENSLENLEQSLNDMKEKVHKALQVLEKIPEKPAELVDSLNKLGDNLNFLNEIKNCVYVPIPLNLPTSSAEGELYVFKDKRGKNKNQARSALIGLDTVNLGRVEAYIQKSNADLSIQFRLENMKIAPILKAHHKKLDALLESAGLKLKNLSVISIESAFSVLNNEPESKSASYNVDSLSFDVKA